MNAKRYGVRRFADWRDDRRCFELYDIDTGKCESFPGTRKELEAAAKEKNAYPRIKARLEYLRGEIEAERISYEEIAELQSLTEYIDKDDVQLLEWAGVEEFPNE
jgi:hypothetical protein